MNEEKLEKIYQRIRIAIYFIPILIVVAGIYLIFFPIENYYFRSVGQKLPKIDVSKDLTANQLLFGAFPSRDYHYVKLSMDFKKSGKRNCKISDAEVVLSKSYQSFLYPTGDAITTESRLRELLFDSNETRYPNGSLLHLKPTNEVFFISRGKKILFPGPEIFQAFGFSFDNLTDVEQSDIDEFPNAEEKAFLWTTPHPDGTIFQSYPSKTFFLVFEGKKHLIENKDLIFKIWPEYYSILVNDQSSETILKCSAEKEADKLICDFDISKLSPIGRYYFFSVKFPEKCPIENIHPKTARIKFLSEKSFSTVRQSLRNIAASVLNRYFYKQ